MRDRRIKLNLSPKELAENAGISQRALVKIEDGRIIPAVPVLQLIATALSAELIVKIAPRETIAVQAKKPKSRWSRL